MASLQMPQFAPLGNPIASGIDQLIEARRYEKEMEMKRAEMLQRQQQAQAEMAQKAEYLKIAQANQARAQQTQAAGDIEAIRGYAATDPGFAAQYGQALGYQKQQAPQPDAVDQVLAGPSTTQRGAPSLGDLGGQSSDLTDDYGNAMQASTPEMPTPERSQSAVQSQNKIQAANQASKRLRFGRGGQSFEIDPEAASAADEKAYQRELGKRTAASQEAAEAAKLRQDAQLEYQRWQTTENNASDERQAGMRRRAGGGGPSRAALRDEKKDAADKAVGNVYDQQGNVIANVSTGDVTSDRQRGERLRAASELYQSLRSNIDELQSEIGKGKAPPTAYGIGTDLANRRGALHAKVLLQLKEAEKLGVLAGPDMGLMEQSIGSKAMAEMGVDNGKLGTAASALDRGFEKSLGTYGLQGGEVRGKLRGQAAPQQQAAAKANPIVRGNRASKLAGEDKAAHDWARANPTDPRAKAIMERLGL